MVSITLSVPPETKKRMEMFPEINWSGLVRKTIEEKTEELEWKRKMLKKLDEEKSFEEWTVRMGRKVNEGIARRLKKEGLL